MKSSNRRVSIRTAQLIGLAAAILIGLFLLPQSANAGGECQKVKATANAVNHGDGTASGRITKGGRLNGTTQVVVTGAFTPTPNPNTFSFTDDFTLTTMDGTLTTHNVSLLNLAVGVGSAIALIDPNSSSGSFAGATGVLYFNFRTSDGVNIQEEISGDVCFAN